MPILTADQLHDERLLNTTQERQVLALEMIADQLAAIGHQLEGIRTGEMRASDSPVAPSPKAMEVGKGSVAPEINKAVTRHMIEVFSVGPYRYTMLDDALAQAARAALAIQRDISHLLNRRIG